MPVAATHQSDINQRRAADPSASAWVSASAGTGKTYVLVNRILRLLLEGVRPERILCLTFTNIAAAEMQNRLHSRLMEWASASQAELAEALEKLTGESPPPELAALARRLFALTLETEGGLKIHTIHGFCERLLHRFPLEAGIAADFTVLDETSAGELRQDAVDRVLSSAADDDSSLNEALGEVIPLAAEQSFRSLLDGVLGRGTGSADRAGTDQGAKIGELLGSVACREPEAIIADIAALLDGDALDEAIELLASGGVSDRAKADHLVRAKAAGTKQEQADAFRAAFLTQRGEPFARMATTALAAEAPDTVAALESARDACHRLVLEERGVRLVAANAALGALGREVERQYRAAKAARAALDYDDLINKAADLLRVSEAASWVLYKLDGGIDHILVDEAQAPSPLQWSVIRALAEEFFSGLGAREADRTVFAVGDEKQSIYRFQGAEPKQFAAQGQAFAKRVGDAGRPWQALPLNLSFRSTATVLKAVDNVFAVEEAAKGLTWGGQPVSHFPNRQDQTGAIEIWETVTPEEPDETPPFEPWRAIQSQGDAADAVAGRIADRIKYWCAEKIELPSRGRPIEPGDILILVRRRKPFAAPMIRALKERGIPVAGADRMRLCEQIAVMDLMALGDFVLLPEDDLTLATLLKTPLIGLDDDDLFRIAHGRQGSLWDALRAKAPGHQRYERARDQLQRWLARADYLQPYEFFASLLEEEGGAARRAMIGRLGPDAVDAIDEFLNLALSFDADNPPSLQSFLDWVRRADVEIKRDMEQGRNEVRIMTVHGAKGLEADIVFLPDTCGLGRADPSLLPLEQTEEVEANADWLWVPPGLSGLDAVDRAKGYVGRLEREEYHRLLYVAMTRARDQLIVCGWEGANGRGRGCWYDLIWQGLEEGLEETSDERGEKVWRIAGKDAAGIVVSAAQGTGTIASAVPPDWSEMAASDEARRAVALTPSSAVTAAPGAESQAFQEQLTASPAMLADQSRFLRGKLIHALLEHLPELDVSQWEARARSFVEAKGEALGADAREEIVAEVIRLLKNSDFTALFGPESQAEVPLVARIPGDQGEAGLEISGQVDRLVIGAEEILIADYKTNRPPPNRVEDVAPAYLAQLATYRMALARLYPDSKVRCALIWTALPSFMEVPGEVLDDYQRAISSRA